MRGGDYEHSYVDDFVYKIPEDLVEKLQIPRWQYQQCLGLNEKPEDKIIETLTVDDLYCQYCETWQFDIPGFPSYDSEAKLKCEVTVVEKKSRFENPIESIEYKEFREKAKNKTNLKKIQKLILKNSKVKI